MQPATVPAKYDNQAASSTGSRSHHGVNGVRLGPERCCFAQRSRGYRRAGQIGRLNRTGMFERASGRTLPARRSSETVRMSGSDELFAGMGGPAP